MTSPALADGSDAGHEGSTDQGEEGTEAYQKGVIADRQGQNQGSYGGPDGLRYELGEIDQSGVLAHLLPVGQGIRRQGWQDTIEDAEGESEQASVDNLEDKYGGEKAVATRVRAMPRPAT